MAKLFSAKGFSKQFGESFLTSLENERKRIQEQKLFNQKLGFQNRQLDLLDKYRQGTLENYAKQEKRLNEQGIANLLGTGLYTLGEVGRVNQRTGEKDTSPNFNLFGETFTYLPETPKQPIIRGKVTDYSSGKPVIYGYTDAGDKIRLGTGKLENTTTNPPGDTTPPPPNPLNTKQFRVNALNNLQNPAVFNENDKLMSNEAIKGYLDDNVNTLATGLLDSGTLKWLQSQKSQYGRYPSPEELRQEALQKGSGLTKGQKVNLKKFLDVYYNAYGGINELQRILINPKYREYRESKKHLKVRSGF